MERLTVRFTKGLPKSITRTGGSDESAFMIPKTKRLKTLEYMQRHSQYIVKRRKSSWDVVGTLPAAASTRHRRDVFEGRGGGGGGSYGNFLRNAKKALEYIPDHTLGRLSRGELQKHPRIKSLYERHFKNNPDLISYDSVLNVIASDLLNYDASTGAVRESIADVRLKKKMPTSTLSLSITKDSDFDRILLQSLSDELARRNIPMVFVKSSYFTALAQLQQLFQDNPATFAGALESARPRVKAVIWRDYMTLVNETNRIYLSKYPFERIAMRDIGLSPLMPGFSSFKPKLQTIVQLSLATPGSAGHKFKGLEEMWQTYAATLEAQLMNPDHFMHGLHKVLTNDTDFVISVLKNSSRSLAKVSNILKGNSL